MGAKADAFGYREREVSGESNEMGRAQSCLPFRKPKRAWVVAWRTSDRLNCNLRVEETGCKRGHQQGALKGPEVTGSRQGVVVPRH